MNVTLKDIKERFLGLVKTGLSFEESAEGVNSLLCKLPNAENYQIVFDTLHWYWEGETKNRLRPEELDRICLKLSPFREYQEAEIQKQIESANEWRDALVEAGMSPMDALSLAKVDCEVEVAIESANTAIATSKSDIAIPQEIVRLYRHFYRAAKFYNPDKTNAIKPLLLAKEVITKSSSTKEDLVQEIVGRIVARMNQVRGNNALGRYVVRNKVKEIDCIRRFADFIVYNVLEQKFSEDKSWFSSQKGIGLIEDACYYLYILEQEKENEKFKNEKASKEDS